MDIDYLPFDFHNVLTIREWSKGVHMKRVEFFISIVMGMVLFSAWSVAFAEKEKMSDALSVIHDRKKCVQFYRAEHK